MGEIFNPNSGNSGGGNIDTASLISEQSGNELTLVEGKFYMASPSRVPTFKDYSLRYDLADAPKTIIPSDIGLTVMGDAWDTSIDCVLEYHYTDKANGGWSDHNVLYRVIKLDETMNHWDGFYTQMTSAIENSDDLIASRNKA